MEDFQLLKDLGTLGFIDYVEDFFEKLNQNPNVFVTKDIEGNYFVQFIFSDQVNSEMLKPKYKFLELTMVYEKDKNRFSNYWMVRSARSTVSGDFTYIPKHWTNDFGGFITEWDPNKDFLEVTLEGIPTGPLTKKEFILEYFRYTYYFRYRFYNPNLNYKEFP